MILPTETLLLMMNDNAANTIVADATGTGDGMLGGGDNTEDLNAGGHLGDALHFDGTADYVDMNRRVLPTDGSAWWASAWVYVTDATPAAGSAIVFGQYESLAAGRFSLHLAPIGTWRIYNPGCGFVTCGSAAADTWQMLTVAVDASGNVATYLGSTSGGTGSSMSNIQDVDSTVAAGWSSFSGETTAYPFPGRIDTLRAGTGLLLPGMVKRLYAAGHGTTKTLAELYAENDGPFAGSF